MYTYTQALQVNNTSHLDKINVMTTMYIQIPIWITFYTHNQNVCVFFWGQLAHACNKSYKDTFIICLNLYI